MDKFAFEKTNQRDEDIEVRLDAINVLNHPNFGNPSMDINSVNFGLTGLPTSGNRQFTFNARLNL